MQLTGLAQRLSPVFSHPAQPEEAGAKSGRHKEVLFSQENTHRTPVTHIVPSAILRAALPMAAQGINPGAPPCVQLTGTDSGDRQGD